MFIELGKLYFVIGTVHMEEDRSAIVAALDHVQGLIRQEIATAPRHGASTISDEGTVVRRGG